MAFQTLSDFQYIGPGGELTAQEELFVQTLASRANYNSDNVVVMNSSNGGLPGQILRVNSAGTALEWANISVIGGTITTGQIAFGTAANTIGGSVNLLWDNADIRLKIGNPPDAGAYGTLNISGSATPLKPQIRLYGTGINDWAEIRWDNTIFTIEVPANDTINIIGGGGSSAPNVGVNIQTKYEGHIVQFKGDKTSDFYGNILGRANLIIQGTATIGTLSGVLKASSGLISGGATTSDLPEGTNLYFTNARARSSISANAPITYNSTTGVIGLSTPLAISYGGTGLSSLGTANQILGVNSGATGLQYRNITSLLSAGSGISITGTSTATISNTGVLSLNSLTGSLTLQGTTNQINVSSGGSTITLSTPQDIAPTSTPIFGGLTLNGNLNLKGNQILNANYIIKFKKVTTSPYTLVLTDSQNVCLQMDTIGDNTVIIPTDASVPFPIGTKIMIQKYGLGITTIQGASGVIVRDPFFSWVIKDDYNIVEIIKMGTNEWVIKY